MPESGGTTWTGNEYGRWLFEQGVSFTQYDEKGYVIKGMPEQYHQTTWCVDKVIDWVRFSAAKGTTAGLVLQCQRV